MPANKTKFLYCAILFMTLNACKTTTDQSQPGSLKFGHTIGWNNTTIATVSPGETVFVCDAGAGSAATKLVRQALEEWIATSSLEGGITAELSCDTDPILPAISVKMHECAREQNWAETISTGARQWTIRFCRDDARTYDFALHEMGHVFGQCDRYSDAQSLYHPSKGNNCSDVPASTDGEFEAKSAMQAGGSKHPFKVTLDDANGVFGLIMREDIKGADQWRKFIQGEAQQSELKSQFITMESANQVTAFAYFSRRVKKIELIDGNETIVFGERRQPQKGWPDIRAAYPDRKWRNKKEVTLRVTKLDDKSQEVTVPASHK